MKSNVKRLLLLFALSSVMAMFLVACGGGNGDDADGGGALVGRWEAVSFEFIENGYTTDFEEISGGEIYLEFFSDGNGMWADFGQRDSFTWSSDNGRLTIVESGEAFVIDYSISGSTLTMNHDYGWGIEITTLRRVN